MKYQYSVLAMLVLTACVSSQNCKCVVYFQCNETTLTVITGGEGFIAERFKECSCNNCADSEVCCKVPDYPNRLSQSETCGISNPDGVGYKIGTDSTPTTFGEFPWMVAILIEEKYRCGGSLIHPSAVLTAAHCVREKAIYTIRAGEWDTSSNSSEIYPHQDRLVSSIEIHENYSHGNYFNDVALLFVETPFDLAAHINPICLPPAGDVVQSGSCYASGWGKRFGSPKGNEAILKKVLLPIVPRDKCQRDLRKTRVGEYFILHGSFICAGGEEGKDTCEGDGGGPLVCPIDAQDDKYQQIGIVSWGLGCGDKDVPAVYADVARARNWIDKKMKDANLHISG